MLVCTEVGLAAASYLGLMCGTMLVCTALRLAAALPSRLVFKSISKYDCWVRRSMDHVSGDGTGQVDAVGSS